jgi:hypothetical protein
MASHEAAACRSAENFFLSRALTSLVRTGDDVLTWIATEFFRF